MQKMPKQLLQQTKKIALRFQELDKLIAAPEIMADNNLYLKIAEERNSISAIANKHHQLQQTLMDLDKYRSDFQHSTDLDLKKLLLDEIKIIEQNMQILITEIKELLVVSNNTDTSLILEIKAENHKDSALFAAQLLNMYKNYAQLNNYSFEILSSLYKDNDKLKKAIIAIKGKATYNKLKHENGYHKAIGLSKKEDVFVYILVLPQLSSAVPNIKDNDLKIDVFHSGGAGGQHVNKVETAVRVTHLPTNITATCQNERSQLKNKEMAKKILKERVLKHYSNQQAKELKSLRKKNLNKNKPDCIRTYNFAQNKVTSNITDITSSLDEVLGGKLDIFIGLAEMLQKNTNIDSHLIQY